eukprot:5970862-Amphidinium_carterae.1
MLTSLWGYVEAAGETSTVYSEYSAYGPQDRHTHREHWEAPLRRLEPTTLSARLSSFRSWCQWAIANNVSQFQSSAVHVANYLSGLRTHGSTASKHALVCLKSGELVYWVYPSHVRMLWCMGLASHRSVKVLYNSLFYPMALYVLPMYRDHL